MRNRKLIVDFVYIFGIRSYSVCSKPYQVMKIHLEMVEIENGGPLKVVICVGNYFPFTLEVLPCVEFLVIPMVMKLLISMQ